MATDKKKNKKIGCCGTIIWIVIIFSIIGAVFGGNDKENANNESKKEAKKNSRAETGKKQEEKVSFKNELEVFSSGNYLFVTNEDLDKYCTNMKDINVYVVTDIDDIKDGKIQSTLSDGFMMSGFNVGDRYSKYESSLEEGDIVAICGTVAGQDSYGGIGNSVSLNDCYVFAVGEEANGYRKEKSDDELNQYFSVTKDVADSNEVSEEDYKSLCQKLGYTDILRNPDAYEGKYCVVSGTVDQVIEGWLGSYTIFVMDGNENKWGCTYSYDDGETHILEGDSVVAYGKCNGVANTETLLGEQVTLPHISVEYWD